MVWDVNRILSQGMACAAFCLCVCIVYCLEAEIDYYSNQRNKGWHCGLVLFWCIIVVLMLTK